MKRTVFLAILILSLACVAGAQIGPTTNSFRNAATSGSGLMEDDLDLLVGYRGFLDASRIPMVEGKRLYTSLANIVDKNEEVFNGSGNGYFLIGGSTKLSTYGSAGAFYDRWSMSTPLDLPPIFGSTLGHGERTDVSLSGGHAQFRDELNRTADAKQDSVTSQVLVGFGRDLSEGKSVGLSFYHTDGSVESQDWGDTLYSNRFGNFTYKEVLTDLDSNRVLESNSWTGTQKGGGNFSTNVIGLAGWMPYGEKNRIGLQLMGGLVSISPKDEAQYDRLMTTYGTVVTREDHGTRKLTFTNSGLSFDGQLSGICKWSEATESRTDVSFGLTNLKNKSGDNWMERVSFGGIALDTSSTFNTNTDESAYSNTKDNTTRFAAFTRTTSKLSDRVTFAMGLGFNHSNRDMKLPATETSTQVVAYKRHAGGTDPTDYTATTTYTYQVEGDTTQKVNTVSIPVGLEFHVTEPVVIRLGALHTISSVEVKSTDRFISWNNPVITRTVYGDGHVVIDTLGYQGGPFTSTAGTTKSKMSETYYTYGAGWNYSERLQLDFMGFAKLNDLTNWKLSATLKF